jgi:hypothetical protein
MEEGREMGGSTAGAAHPGPAPIAPLLPVVGLQRLAAQLEVLVDEVNRTRWVHEDAFDCITNDRFAGSAGDDFRERLAGQLRRAAGLRTALLEDLDHVRWLLAQARTMQDRHELALQAWHREVATWQRAVLEAGLGPTRPPRREPAQWARQRGLP